MKLREELEEAVTRAMLYHMCRAEQANIDRSEKAAEKSLAALERVYEIERKRQEADIRQSAASGDRWEAVQAAREAAAQARMAAEASRACLNKTLEHRAAMEALVASLGCTVPHMDQQTHIPEGDNNGHNCS